MIIFLFLMFYILGRLIQWEKRVAKNAGICLIIFFALFLSEINLVLNEYR